jgi:hypothetical protein
LLCLRTDDFRDSSARYSAIPGIEPWNCGFLRSDTSESRSRLLRMGPTNAKNEKRDTSPLAAHDFFIF